MAKPKDKKTDTNKNRKRKAVRRISKSSSDLSEPVLCDTSDEEDKENEATKQIIALDAEKIIIRLVLWKTGSSVLLVTGGYMKTVPSLMICAPNVDRRRKKKLKEPNFRAREREKY
ncbi:hypothetical protein HF086_016313 [Spodoptera exigua]|uniref:Uncharacterized protein n=1 Tax=Spodoptera exigua TaxID=7107 RepID=A0A922MBW2_SPOEX|nr:hypothetical protein HF086_016313 [Spodoptera exigua]